MDDKFASHARGLTSPATEHFPIAPADGVDLPQRPLVLYVEASGVVKVRDAKDNVLSYTVVRGQILPFSGVGVEATGTTATVYGWS
ncbi:hypothetical protein FEE96_06160 [Parasedimentitalea maritima]|uniref:Uncharacterized protein n=1 Tax=Parasedimentitalea maritima TaxID=2578117 RepID=A0ABY2UZ21_9RHOB|nr:hypothetical protein [Zongyanglinia marina]TLP68094.1 hypothetical protein FEE96_06160 [Zongyanglinia marina]